ncbi:MAG: hypothetical protein WDZ59_13380 [Pirellulales bacterium]
MRRWIGILLLAVWPAVAGAAESSSEQPGETAAQRGYRLLTEKPYLPPDFDQATFDNLWRVWEEPLRSQAAEATPEARREMAFQRYGLVVRPGDPQQRPMQYVVDAQGQYVMNCMACHQGKVAGRMVPGVANSLLALETLTEDVRRTKLMLLKSWSRMERGSLVMPLGTTVGTTNAVMFGVALMHYRDADLNVHTGRLPPPMVHHDHDAPAWWHYGKKTRLYADGFVPKSHRALMPFLLVRENGPEKFRQWEDDFKAIEAYLESLDAPNYPGAVDRDLASLGEEVFVRMCSECHGTYGSQETYPQRIVPLDEVGTDPVRLTALSEEHRRGYRDSWFGYYGEHDVKIEPQGYLAPPLDGIWASAPYFHNGSVPTLWHVLHPSERPTVWRRTAGGYDHTRVGLEVSSFDEVPGDIESSAERRWYFDTRQFGKSAAGHEFPEVLTEDEKRALLEYLKTL